MASTSGITTKVAPAPVETKEQDTNDVGLFVVNTFVGYMEPDEAIIQKIMEDLEGKVLSQCPTGFLKDLLAIKLIIPEESQELKVYALPQAIQLIRQIRHIVAAQYYERR